MLPECITPTIKHGRRYVFIWGCFSFAGTGDLVRGDGIIKKYRRILEHNAISSGMSLIGRGFEFMHNNDPKHTSKMRKDYLKSQTDEQILKVMTRDAGFLLPGYIVQNRLTTLFRREMNILRNFIVTAQTRIYIGATKMNTIKNTSYLSELCKQLSSVHISERQMATLNQMHKTGPHKKLRPPKQPLDGNPFMKGVVLKTLVKKPKKPNSANRKCVLVRLSNGNEMIAYIPGIGHNLQEHNIVLCRVGRVQDCPGVKLKCIRGKYDLAHVIIPKK